MLKWIDVSGAKKLREYVLLSVSLFLLMGMLDYPGLGSVQSDPDLLDREVRVIGVAGLHRGVVFEGEYVHLELLLLVELADFIDLRECLDGLGIGDFLV